MFIPQMIHDKNLTDGQVMGVLRKLRKFWKFGIPKYIASALKFKKRQLDHLYTKVIQCHVYHNTAALPKCVATSCTPKGKSLPNLVNFQHFFNDIIQVSNITLLFQMANAQVRLDGNSEHFFTDDEGNPLVR